MMQQLFLKRGAEDVQASTVNWIVGMLSSHWFLAAIAAEVVCFVIWLSVLAEVELSKAFPLSALSYVLIMTVAFFVFGEHLSALQLVGSCLILTGIWCIVAAPSHGR
jgi:multidrug transporter EmrE-like cation transporter